MLAVVVAAVVVGDAGTVVDVTTTRTRTRTTKQLQKSIIAAVLLLVLVVLFVVVEKLNLEAAPVEGVVVAAEEDEAEQD